MWLNIDNNAIETFPKEGVEVLVSDGTNYDVAWYLMSSEYIWKKNIINEDNTINFESFIPTKWCHIDPNYVSNDIFELKCLRNSLEYKIKFNPSENTLKDYDQVKNRIMEIEK